MNGVRNQWGTARWFAVMVGVVAAVAVTSLNVLLHRGLAASARGRVVFFFFAGAVMLVALPYLGGSDWQVTCALLVGAGAAFYAGVATCMGWRGFELERDAGVCPTCGCEFVEKGEVCPECGDGHVNCAVCGYDLTGNESGVCPECGAAVEAKAGG